MGIIVSVRNLNPEVVIKQLKRKMQRENMFKKLKEKRYYIPPSKEKVLKKQESKQKIKLMKRARKHGSE